MNCACCQWWQAEREKGDSLGQDRSNKREGTLSISIFITTRLVRCNHQRGPDYPVKWPMQYGILSGRVTRGDCGWVLLGSPAAKHGFQLKPLVLTRTCPQSHCDRLQCFPIFWLWYSASSVQCWFGRRCSCSLPRKWLMTWGMTVMFTCFLWRASCMIVVEEVIAGYQNPLHWEGGSGNRDPETTMSH